MFVRFKNIDTNALIVDTRSCEEFKAGSITDINIPIISKELHDKLKTVYPLAVPIILYGLYRDRKIISEKLKKLEHKDIIFSCSRGRLRSPIMHLYAKSLGINSKVLLYGIKGVKNG